MERIAVVGAGLMGHGIAQVFACAGHPVAITDTAATVLDTVSERVAANLERLGLDPTPAAEISLHVELEAAVVDADVVFEAASEDLALKRSLFERMSRSVSRGAILATNTSVIRVTEIAAAALEPGRIVGTHWWNPPFLVPLVEVVQAERTSPETVETITRLLERVGKAPVHVRKDVPGFIGNRLQHALWREAFALVDAGVCDPQTVDRVVTQGFGLRLPVLGPVENADLVGLDLILPIHTYLFPHLDRALEPARVLQDRVEHGALGVKTGRGFRDWAPDEAQAVHERLFHHLAHAVGATDNDPRKETQLR
jgi:3-hydroxybutyryl-CoA dehydrogenase